MAIRPATIDVGPSMKPSGMCIASTAAPPRSFPELRTGRSLDCEPVADKRSNCRSARRIDDQVSACSPAAPDDGEVRAVEHEVVVPREARADRVEDLARHGQVAAADLAHEVTTSVDAALS